MSKPSEEKPKHPNVWINKTQFGNFDCIHAYLFKLSNDHVEYLPLSEHTQKVAALESRIAELEKESSERLSGICSYRSLATQARKETEALTARCERLAKRIKELESQDGQS